MQIDQLRIQGIGPFQEEHTFFLGEGCTLIQGGNETGKTSLAEAMFGAVFGFPPRPLEDDAKTASWVEITFRRGSRSFVLLRECPGNHVVLVETSDSGEETLFEGTTENPDDAETYRTRLALILGEGDGSAWSRSGFVRDGELTTQLDGTVRAWLAGQRQGDGEAALSRLESELAQVSEDLDSGNGDRGEPARIRRERETKHAALAGWAETATKLTEIREACGALERERAELPEVTEDDEEEAAYLETLERFDGLVAERERLEASVVSLQEEKDRIRKCIEDEEEAREKLEKDYADILNFPEDLEDVIQRWVTAINRRQELDKTAEGDAEAEAPPPPGSTTSGIVVSVVVAALATLGCFGAGAPMLGFVLFPVVFGGGLTVTWVRSRSGSRVNQEEEERRIRRAAEMDALDAEVRKIKESVQVLGAFETPASLRRQFRGFLAAQEKREQARNLASEQRRLAEVVDEYEHALSELQVVDSKTREMVAEASYLSGMDAKREALAEELRRVRSRRNEPDARRQELEDRMRVLKAERASLEDGLESPGRLLDAVADLDRAEAAIIQRRTALTVAVKAFRRALEDEPEDALGLVLEHASSLLGRLTRDRCTAVRLDADQEPEVEMDGRWQGPESLSRRSQDQMWLAIRLAAHEEAGERALPIVLDEPFAGWDDARLETAREILDEIAGDGRQVILLSSDRRLAAWTSNVLSLRLPKRAAGDSERQAA